MMFMICTLVLLFIPAFQIRGTNIMLNKPTIQSSTYDHTWLSSNANDGRKNTNPSHTLHETYPYWQGDLLGFYKVHTISVTSDNSVQAEHLRNAFIGVSPHDVGCPNGNVTICGQRPDFYDPGRTHVYNCPHADSVRFVRIWRHVVSDGLAISEVEVEGEPSKLAGGTVYDKFMSKKVSTLITSLTVGSVTGCGNMCHRTQPCLVFSYSPFLQPDCLLATDTTMTSDVMWVSYKIRRCFRQPTCDVSGFL